MTANVIYRDGGIAKLKETLASVVNECPVSCGKPTAMNLMAFVRVCDAAQNGRRVAGRGYISKQTNDMENSACFHCLPAGSVMKAVAAVATEDEREIRFALRAVVVPETIEIISEKEKDRRGRKTLIEWEKPSKGKNQAIFYANRKLMADLHREKG